MELERIDSKILASIIDHTYLKPNGGREPIDKLCNEALQFGFGMVAINPCEVHYCKKRLRGSKVKVGAAIGFPLGQNTIATKAFEIKNSIDYGADEIDMVVNQSAIKDENYELIEKEIKALTKLCRSSQVTSKLILECCNLEEKEIIKTCKIASNNGCDFVKTSTGFASGGATINDVILMKRYVSSQVRIKAAGGIRTLEQVVDLIRAGANRIGTSQGVKIIKELSGLGSVELRKG